MTNQIHDIFFDEDEERIVASIRQAEVTTSGEIRVHISQKEDNNPLESSKQIFQELRMFNTKDRNGVLLHISLASRNFAIYGDEGINHVVPEDFWESTKTFMQEHFRVGNLVDGICEGVLKIGEQLQTHFPWQENDRNELSDDISYD